MLENSTRDAANGAYDSCNSKGKVPTARQRDVPVNLHRLRSEVPLTRSELQRRLFYMLQLYILYILYMCVDDALSFFLLFDFARVVCVFFLTFLLTSFFPVVFFSLSEFLAFVAAVAAHFFSISLFYYYWSVNLKIVY